MIYIEQFERGQRIGYGKINENEFETIEGKIDLKIPHYWERSAEEYTKFVVRGMGNAQQWSAQKTGFRISDTPI